MGDQSFVSQDIRARVRDPVTPIAVGAGKFGLTPNALTVIGFLISGVAAAAAAPSYGSRPPRSSSSAARSTCSTAGSPAPRTGSPGSGPSSTPRSTAGARESSTSGSSPALRQPALSRERSWPPPRPYPASRCSYTRAKAESLNLHGEVGIAPRAERLVLLTIGLVSAGLDGGLASGARGQLWLSVALGVIFVTASITAVQRTWHVRTQLRNEEQGAK